MVEVRYTAEGSYRVLNNSKFEMTGKHVSDAQGMNPMELVSSSLALCVAISIISLLNRDGLEANGVSVTAEAVKANRSPARIERFRVAVVFPDTIDLSQREKYTLLAERACTIGNTLKTGAQIDIQIK